ncbi:glycosyltransferase family 4 protein [Haloechinothrix aidingensis]|nr:glycosyltransferase family 4 protein [Haloechinothrix aidingensis]
MSSTGRVALMVHPSAELYGSDRMFAESVAALAERGWRVVAALPHDGPLAELLREHAHVVHCPTAVLRKTALRPAGLLRLIVDSVRATPRMLGLLKDSRPDVVYVNTLTVPQWIVMARLCRKPVLAHVHEAEDEVAAPVRVALAAPLLAAHTVVVNSDATRRSITAALPRLARTSRLLYNGVAGPEHAVQLRTYDPSPVGLVLVGRLSPRKGTDIAVEAVAELLRDGHDVTLDLVGSAFTGYEWFERRIRSRVDELELTGRVSLRGFTEEVWRAYARADIALVPSRVEPFGNTAVEAQLAGVPVVVTDTQGLPETVAHGTYGSVVPRDDPRALADAIAAMLDDWPHTRRIAERARSAALERFAPATYRAGLAGIAADLIERDRER